MVDFINEQNACVYILDCMANLTDSGEEEVKNLVKQAVWQIRKKHDTPVLLVEHAGYSNGITNQKQYDAYMRANIGQAKAYKELKKEGVKICFICQGKNWDIVRIRGSTMYILPILVWSGKLWQ